jgi:hypothetical protein
MTWNEYIELAARRLGACRNEKELKAELAQIEVFLADKTNVPPDFWNHLAAEYETAPKWTQKEAAAAAALNALVTSAQALLNARGKGK